MRKNEFLNLSSIFAFYLQVVGIYFNVPFQIELFLELISDEVFDFGSKFMINSNILVKLNRKLNKVVHAVLMTVKSLYLVSAKSKHHGFESAEKSMWMLWTDLLYFCLQMSLRQMVFHL